MGFFFLMLIGISAPFPAYSETTMPPLSADQAFVLSVVFNRHNELLAEWKMAQGYYFYAKKMQITFTPNLTSNIQFPQGDLKYDQEAKRYEAYSGNVIIPILLNTKLQQAQMRIDYQGCSEDGFCYPPMQRIISLNLAAQTISQNIISKNTISKNNTMTSVLSQGASFQSLLTNQYGIQALLSTSHFIATLLIFAGFGLLLAFTPCVLPMIPILTTIIIGQNNVKPKKAFFLSLVYVLGMAVVYALAGWIAASLGNSLQVNLQTPLAISIMSAFFVLLALSLFGLYDFVLSQKLYNRIVKWSGYQRGGNYFSVFFMGVFSTLIISPCVSAPFVGVLMYIGQTGDRLLGMSALFAMGIGMGIPLLLIGTTAAKWIPRTGPWMEAIKKLFGLLMIGLAIWLLSRVIPPMVSLFLWSVLLVSFVIFIGIYLPQFFGRRIFYRSFGAVIGLSGMFIVLTDMSSLYHANTWINTKPLSGATQSFIVVHDMAALNQQLALAKESKQPVILDFYADWCESCVIMERQVFRNLEVNQALRNKNYVLLRADLSENSAADEAFLKYFNVIAPPTVLFFNSMGDELNSMRIVGEINTKEFLIRLQKIPGSVALNQ